MVTEAGQGADSCGTGARRREPRRGACGGGEWPRGMASSLRASAEEERGVPNAARRPVGPTPPRSWNCLNAAMKKAGQMACLAKGLVDEWAFEEGTGGGVEV